MTVTDTHVAPTGLRDPKIPDTSNNNKDYINFNVSFVVKHFKSSIIKCSCKISVNSLLIRTSVNQNTTFFVNIQDINKLSHQENTLPNEANLQAV